VRPPQASRGTHFEQGFPEVAANQAESSFARQSRMTLDVQQWFA